MHIPHSKSVRELELRARTAFAKFNSSVALDAQVETARPGARQKLATALRNATLQPDRAFEKAAADLRKEVAAVAQDWEAIRSDCRKWLDVADALRGEDVVITEPALCAAVESVKSSPQAASLAREIESAVSPVLATVTNSAARHIKTTDNAMRHVIHKTGIRVYSALGRDRAVQAHQLRLERAKTQAAAYRTAETLRRAGVR